MAIELFIPGRDLVDHFTERATYHTAKAQAYLDEADAVQAIEKPDPHMSNDPVYGLRQSANSHKEKATYMYLLAKYLRPEKEYEVKPSELAQLEFIERMI